VGKGWGSSWGGSSTSSGKQVVVQTPFVSVSIDIPAEPQSVEDFCGDKPPTSVIPKRYHEDLPAPLDWLRFDGVSPFLTQQPKAEGTNLTLPLQGRGKESPLRMDPFGAGARVSSKYAYKSAKVCSTMRYPHPTSGTIVGFYLMDFHPTGSLRNMTKWHEIDYEWLGLKPNGTQSTVFEMGLDKPSAEEHLLANITGANITHTTPGTKYCMDWDFREDSPKQGVKFTIQAAGQDERLVREWFPHTPELEAFWDGTPLRVLYTIWSNNNIEQWSGKYSIAKDTVLQVEFSDISFEPRGNAYCVQMDRDLEPVP